MTPNGFGETSLLGGAEASERNGDGQRELAGIESRFELRREQASISRRSVPPLVNAERFAVRFEAKRRFVVWTSPNRVQSRATPRNRVSDVSAVSWGVGLGLGHRTELLERRFSCEDARLAVGAYKS